MENFALFSDGMGSIYISELSSTGYASVIKVYREIDSKTVTPRDFHGEARWEYSYEINSHWVTYSTSEDRRWDYGISPESILAAKKLWEAEFQQIRREIEQAKNHPAWKLMQEIVEDHMQSYKPDFYFYDSLRLARENPQTLLWAVRETGTWLFTERVSAKSYRADFGYVTLQYSLSHEPHRFFFWDKDFPDLLKELDHYEVMNYFYALPVEKWMNV